MSVDEGSTPVIRADDNAKGYLEADAQEIQKHNYNRETDQHANNSTISSSGNEIVVDCECSISWPIMQRYLQHIYKSGKPLRIWINFQFSKQTRTVVAAYFGRIAERNRMHGEFGGVALETSNV
jgi:hypothetical protein